MRERRWRDDGKVVCDDGCWLMVRGVKCHGSRSGALAGLVLVCEACDGSPERVPYLKLTGSLPRLSRLPLSLSEGCE